MLHDVNLALPAGGLVMVVGPVGSGKSSLLAAILGELVAVQLAGAAAGVGGVSVAGSVAYTAQVGEERGGGVMRLINACVAAGGEGGLVMVVGPVLAAILGDFVAFRPAAGGGGGGCVGGSGGGGGGGGVSGGERGI